MTKNMNTSVVALVVVTILLMLMPYSLVSNGTVEVAVEEGSIPDGDCLFEPFLAKCTPDKNGECPEGFGKNAYDECFPRHPQGCSEGYHSHEDDESGKCIPDTTGCAEGYIMEPDYPQCKRTQNVCNEFPALDLCTIITHLYFPRNTNSSCEYTVPYFCVEPYEASYWSANGTHHPENNLACYEIRPYTDFKVIPPDRHDFDKDNDGIGCKNNNEDAY
jgi:hypothetical protein